MVGAGRADEIWALPGALPIPGPQDRCTQAIAVGERVKLVPYRVDRLVKRVPVSGHVWVLGVPVLRGEFMAVEEALAGAVLYRDGQAQVAEGDAEEERVPELHCADCGSDTRR